jgi:hypothetical protein
LANSCDSQVVLDLEVDSTSSVMDLAASAEYYAPTILSRAEGTTFTLFSRSNSAACKNGFLSQLDKIKAFLLVAESIRATTPQKCMNIKNVFNSLFFLASFFHTNCYQF